MASFITVVKTQDFSFLEMYFEYKKNSMSVLLWIKIEPNIFQVSCPDRPGWTLRRAAMGRAPGWRTCCPPCPPSTPSAPPRRHRTRSINQTITSTSQNIITSIKYRSVLRLFLKVSAVVLLKSWQFKFFLLFVCYLIVNCMTNSDSKGKKVFFTKWFLVF